MFLLRKRDVCVGWICLAFSMMGQGSCDFLHESDPYADEVAGYTMGSGGGYNETELPDIVLGPPMGGGELNGSLDVFSLGDGGEITLSFDETIIDGPGPDFVVYENPFLINGDSEAVYIEVGIVSVSPDGVQFVTFPHTINPEFPIEHPARYSGFAGVSPVLPGEGPEGIGGDLFDLATIGLKEAHFVRITDPGETIEDYGNTFAEAPAKGFDLDAVGILNVSE